LLSGGARVARSTSRSIEPRASVQSRRTVVPGGFVPTALECVSPAPANITVGHAPRRPIPP